MKLSAYAERLGDHIRADVDNADSLGNMTAFQHGLIRVLVAVDAIAGKLRRRGF